MLPHGLRALTDWLRGHEGTAAAMEGTGSTGKCRSRLEGTAIRADLLPTLTRYRGKLVGERSRGTSPSTTKTLRLAAC